jgi:hypothetical protein
VRIVDARCKTVLFVAAFCDIRAAGVSLPDGRLDLRYFLLGWTDDTTPATSASRRE